MDDCFLDVDVSLSKDIFLVTSLLHARKVRYSANTVNNGISALQKLDTSREKLIKFDNSLHICLINDCNRLKIKI